MRAHKKAVSFLKKRLIGVLAITIALQGLVFVRPSPASATITDGSNALNLLGQLTGDLCASPSVDYTRSDLNLPVTLFGINHVYGIEVDRTHDRLFIADSDNNRVLVFNLNANGTLVDHRPDFVLGQPDFESTGAALTQSGMDWPVHIAYDSVDDDLYVTDSDSNRVLVYDVGTIVNGEPAWHVLGQPDFTTSTPVTTQSGMNYSGGVEIDAANNRLFVSDSGNNRILVFDVSAISDGEPAERVLGQSNYTSSGNAATQAGLSQPIGLAYDAADDQLFVADYSNSRVLVHSVGSTISAITNNQPAFRVWGKSDFVGGAASGNDASLSTPADVAIGPSNLVYVEDNQGPRVMVFDQTTIANGESAVNVIGQADFDGTDGSVSQTTIGTSPSGMAVDTVDGYLYAGSYDTSRAAIFDIDTVTDGEPAVDIVGQYTDDPCGGGVDYTSSNANYPAVNRWSFGEVDGVALDGTLHRLYVADGVRNRVLMFALNGSNQLVDRLPDAVLGQPNFITSAAATTQAGMDAPVAVTLNGSGTRLFVAEANNHRVTVFDVSGSVTNGMNAFRVIGQGNFVSNAAATAQDGLDDVRDVSYDVDNDRLFVAEGGGSLVNNRVMVFDLSGGISNGMNAYRVIGQSSFTATGAAVTQSGFDGAVGVTYDSAHDRLFVADQSNYRVMEFDLSSGISNGMNAAHVLGYSSFTANSGSAVTQNRMSSPSFMAYDPVNDRLFLSENSRVLVFSTATIVDDENAVNVLGQADFTSFAAATSQSGMNGPTGLAYDTTNGVLFIGDMNNNRVLTFDASVVAGTNDPTLNNSITASRLKAGVSSTYNFGFTLQNTITGTLTITFPAGFTVTAAATSGACTGGTVGTFGFTSSTLTAVKTGCTAGALTLSGATVTNHATPGAYTISWVNDDPGEGVIYIIDDDQVTVTGNVDPSLTFNAGMQDDATACDGTFSGNGGTLALGVLTTGVVTTSDASSIDHICTRLSTNSSGGASITVKSLNGTDGLKSTSVPTDTIPSSTATLVAGTAGYGLCTGSAGGDSGNDVISGSSSPTRSSPFNTTCTNAAHNVGGLTTSAQNLWTLSGPSQNAFVRTYVKAAISGTTPAHADYADTLTFIGTGTF